MYIWLKFLSPDGKFKLSLDMRGQFAHTMGFKTVKSFNEHLKQLLALRWITYNNVTGFYIIISLDKLRQKYEWEKRVSVITYPTDLSDPYAYVGGAIYSYLAQNFKRKEKQGKSVSSKGDTFTNFPFSSHFEKYKPVATTGINMLFPEISISKASRLKIAAKKAGFILVKKNYLETKYQACHLHIIKPLVNNVLTNNGKVFLQQIDTILPQMQLRRRRK